MAHQHPPQLCCHYITQVPWPINIILNSVVITLRRFRGPSTSSSTLLTLHYTGSVAHQHHPQLCCHYITQVPWPINIILNSVDITLHRFRGPSTSSSTLFTLHRFRGPSTSSSTLLTLHYAGFMAHQHHPQLCCHYITQVPWPINIILNYVVITLHRFHGPSTSSSTLLSLHYTGSVAHQHHPRLCCHYITQVPWPIDIILYSVVITLRRFRGPPTSSSTMLSLHYTGSMAHQHHPQLCCHYITQVPWPIDIILYSVVITLHRFRGPPTSSSTLLSLHYTCSMAHRHHPLLCCHYITQVPWPINIILDSVVITLHRFRGPPTSSSTLLSLHYTCSMAHRHRPQLCCHYITQVPWPTNIILNSVVITLHRFRGPPTSSSTLLSLHYTGSVAHQHHPQLCCHYITQVPWPIDIILYSVVITLHRFHGPSTSSSTLLSLHYTCSVAHQHHPQLCCHYITHVPWPIDIILYSVVITLHRFRGPSTSSSTLLSLHYTCSMAHQDYPLLCCHYITQVPWPTNIILNYVVITLHRFHGPSTSSSTMLSLHYTGSMAHRHHPLLLSLHCTCSVAHRHHPLLLSLHYAGSVAHRHHPLLLSLHYTGSVAHQHHPQLCCHYITHVPWPINIILYCCHYITQVPWPINIILNSVVITLHMFHGPSTSSSTLLSLHYTCSMAHQHHPLLLSLHYTCSMAHQHHPLLLSLHYSLSLFLSSNPSRTSMMI